MRKFNIKVNGTNYEVEVDEVSPNSDNTFIAPMVSAPVAVKAAAPTASIKGSPFLSPMPGLIKSLKVASGATVKKGQAIVVLEAMKMENDISAHVDGVVTIIVQVGASVASNEVLFTIA